MALQGSEETGLGSVPTAAGADQFTAVPSGGVTVTIDNAPAGTAAAPVRYVKIPDGAGGFYTFASLT